MSLRDSQKTQAPSHFTIPILSPFTSVVSRILELCDARNEVGLMPSLGRTRNGRHQCENCYNIYCRYGYRIVCYVPTLVFGTDNHPVAMQLNWWATIIGSREASGISSRVNKSKRGGRQVVDVWGLFFAEPRVLIGPSAQ